MWLWASALVLLAAGAAACADAYEASGPSDELRAGQLCVPAAEACPSATLLERASALGANRLDFTVTNEGGSAEISVEALEAEDQEQPDASSDATSDATNDATTDAGAPDAGGSDGDTSSLVSRTFSLAPGETASGRFVRTELFARQAFRLRVTCQGCQARVEYALASEPLECRTDNDCSSGWLCSQDDGRCIECRSDDDCTESQTCDTAAGRCDPERSSGCAAAGDRSAPGGPIAVIALALGMLSLVLIRGRRRRHLASAAAAVFVVGLLAAPTAQAQPPRAGINLGVGSRFLTGEMGEHTRRGIGLAVSQELRGEYVGGRFELGANYFLTDQPSPPLSRELQIFTVGIGPQFYLPLGPTEIVLGLDYRRVGLVSNSLVRITGPEVNHGGAGATLEGRYRLAAFDIMVRGGFHTIFGLDSSIISIDVAVGLAAD